MRVASVLSSLGLPHGRDEYEAALAAVGGSWAWTTELSAADARLGGADVSSDEIREWLTGLIPTDTEVLVAWPAERMGARMDYAVWLQHFEDLWHPASDDVVLIPPGGGFVVIDHEEQFSFVHR